MAENVNVNEVATHASVNVSGASLSRLDHVNGQHNRLANGVQNANANANVRVDVIN